MIPILVPPRNWLAATRSLRSGAREHTARAPLRRLRVAANRSAALGSRVAARYAERASPGCLAWCFPRRRCDAMSERASEMNRRGFLRTSAGGGFALGGMLGLGFNLQAAQAEVRKLRIANSREVPSVCPYCAVGCGQLISVRAGKIINIEGNPDSPINRGTLCPKGAATYQLAVNPNRITEVWYREP